MRKKILKSLKNSKFPFKNVADFIRYKFANPEKNIMGGGVESGLNRDLYLKKGNKTISIRLEEK